MSLWNNKGLLEGLLDIIDARSYNNKLVAWRKGDSLVIERYNKKIPATISSVLRGVVNNNTYSGYYQSAADGSTGIFMFTPNKGELVKQQAVLDISLASIDNDQPISLNSHQGKYVLVDFWATYCKTCIPKRTELDSVYSKYKNQLSIISISLDKEIAAVQQFRKEKFAMPWANACVFNNFDAEVCTLFGVNKVGTPSIFLISPDGKLLAKTAQLLHNGIDATLKEYIK